MLFHWYRHNREPNCNINFEDGVPYHDISRHAKCDDLFDILVVTGYVTHNAMSHRDCGGRCKMMFGTRIKPFNLDILSEHLDYFRLLNRGGLTYWSNGLFTVIECGFHNI